MFTKKYRISKYIQENLYAVERRIFFIWYTKTFYTSYDQAEKAIDNLYPKIDKIVLKEFNIP